jgi:AcrR family transcriptional regulator
MKARPRKELGVREKQRQVMRDEILKAALQLFSDRGYSKTTMQAIAAGAGVGIATVFRTYKTKGAVFAALVRHDLEEVFEAGWVVVDSPSDSATSAIRTLLLRVLDVLNMPSKSIRTRRHLWPAVVTGRKEVDEVVRWADRQVQLQIAGILYQFAERAGEPDHQQIIDMTMNLFYIFNGHYADYLAGHTAGLKVVTDNIIRRVAFITGQ